MEQSIRVRELRARTKMNRREFCEYFQIPYRTVSEWEVGNRQAPEYVINLLEYYICSENLTRVDLYTAKKFVDTDGRVIIY